MEYYSAIKKNEIMLFADRANNSSDPISKIPNMKEGWWSGSSGRVSA
jgi:hypothetical protein